MQVLFCLHNMLEAVDLDDALLRLSVAVRLALLLEGSKDPWTAAAVLRQVSSSSASFMQSATMSWPRSGNTCMEASNHA